MNITAQPVLEFSPRHTVGSRVLLRARGLRKSFGGHSVLDDVDLVLYEGEVVLLRGENGSGKTTLLNILTGNLEPDKGTIEYLANGNPRTCRFPRSWLGNLNPFDHFTPEFVAREGLGRTWQDVRLFGSHSLKVNVAIANSRNPGENPLIALFAPGSANRREAEIYQQADTMLAQLGLAGREDSSGDMISLGQSKRVAIARAVAGGARILFLDEPLAGLDLRGMHDTLSLLRAIVREQHLTLVIVEHAFNFTHIQGLVDVHWSLSDGKLSRDAVASILQDVPDDVIPIASQQHWFDLFSQGADVMQTEQLPRGAIMTRFRIKGRYEDKEVLSVKDLVVRRGNRVVVGADPNGSAIGLSLALHKGEIAVLQAPNGWGKSTLFESLVGIRHNQEGSITLHGIEISKMKDWQRSRRGLGLVAAGVPYFNALSAADVRELAGGADRNACRNDVARIDSLSGGQRRQVALEGLSRRRDLRVALLDEPFIALDSLGIQNSWDNLLASSANSFLIAEPLRETY